MISDEKILLAVQESLAEGRQIELFVFYKSCAVTCKASIQSISEDHILVKAEPKRSALLTLDTHTWILCGPPFQPIYARIDEFDIRTGNARLTHLCLSDDRLWKRKTPRVEPREPIEVVLQTQNAAIVERLADISINGIGVYVDNPLDRTLLNFGEVISITMRLPVGVVQVRGKILNVSHTAGLNRLSIVFIENTSVVNLILGYIHDRTAEILHEVERRYDELVEKEITG